MFHVAPAEYDVEGIDPGGEVFDRNAVLTKDVQGARDDAHHVGHVALEDFDRQKAFLTGNTGDERAVFIVFDLGKDEGAGILRTVGI